MKLASLIYEIAAKIEFRELKNEMVSKSDIAWHLDHSLRVINGVISVLKISNPEDYTRTFNIKRILIFKIGSIPRGKARAPKTVISEGEICFSELQEKLERAQLLVSDLENLNSNSNFQHPFFGSLNLKQGIRFLEIHTKHHLKIVDDIMNK